MEPEADVDDGRVRGSAPLRRPPHLLLAQTGERGISLGSAFRERGDDVERATRRVGRIRARTSEITRDGPDDRLGVLRETQRIALAACEPELGVRAGRALP